MRLPAGKVPAHLLRRLLNSLPADDPSVVVGAAFGEDAAVLDSGGPELLVIKTDPITFATEDIGQYLLAVNGNDLATMGAEPRWLLVATLLPEGVAVEEVESVFSSLRGACLNSGVCLVGGHTEITIGLERPILVGCLLGTVARDRLIRTAGASPGDAILLAGGLAIEGSAVLAREHAAVLRARGVQTAVIERAAAWLDKPGISVLPAARTLRCLPGIHSMHDPTEGGLVTALHEVAEAARVGLRVDLDAIPILPDCRTICEALALDPLGLLASGALLATLSPDDVPAALAALAEAGIPAVRIGEVVPAGEGLPLPMFNRDELARFLSAR